MQKRPEFDNARVLILGDVMLDSYWYGPVERISPEAPVPVVHVADELNRLGGAANVALNITALGAQAMLFGLCGQDKAGEQLLEVLSHSAIESRVLACADIKTITKLRVISQAQQLLRLDFEESLEDIDKTALLEVYEAALSRVDLVVLSDYNKGTLSDVGELIRLARQYGKSILVDPKGEDFSQYHGATMLTPNFKEFEAIAGKIKSDEDFELKANAMLDDFKLQALLVTQGSKGMTLFREHQAPFHLSAKAKEIYDVTGAGDTVIGVLAVMLALGLPLEQSLMMANHAASIVVGKLGAETVSADCFNAFFAEEELVLV